MIFELLVELQTPKSVRGLSEAVGAEPGVLEEALMLLEHKGYVAQAYEGSGACPSTCGGCSMKRMCPSSGTSTPPEPVFRLTDKGLRRAASAEAG